MIRDYPDLLETSEQEHEEDEGWRQVEAETGPGPSFKDCTMTVKSNQAVEKVGAGDWRATKLHLCILLNLLCPLQVSLI